MKKLIPKISLAGWSLWFLIAVGYEIQRHDYPSHPTLLFLTQRWFGLGEGCAAIALSAVLIERPKRLFAFMLGVLSLLVLWKFYVGALFFPMHPKLGGLTFSESLSQTWQRVCRDWVTFITIVPFGIFVAASMMIWPFYGVIYGNETKESTR